MVNSKPKGSGFDPQCPVYLVGILDQDDHFQMCLVVDPIVRRVVMVTCCHGDVPCG